MDEDDISVRTAKLRALHHILATTPYSRSNAVARHALCEAQRLVLDGHRTYWMTPTAPGHRCDQHRSRRSGRTLGWTGKEIEAHKAKVATAADLVAIAHNSRITVDVGNKEISAAGHARSVAAS